MSAKEGFNRVVKAISAIGWMLAITIAVILAWVIASEGDPIIGLAIAAFWAAVILVVSQGLVWILDGFLGNRGTSSSIIWPSFARKFIAPPHEWGSRKQDAHDDAAGGR